MYQITENKEKVDHANKLKEALFHLSLCHNVISEGESYTSSSPDELALVSFARFIGYKFIRKNDQNFLEVEETLPEEKKNVMESMHSNKISTLYKFKLLHIL